MKLETDLMASDDEEDKEEIEPVDEEDRAFIENEARRENYPSFYRRLNVELDHGRRQEQRKRQEEMADSEGLLFGEEQIRDNKVLNKLAE